MSTFVCSPSSTVVSTDQGPMYVYPTFTADSDGNMVSGRYETAELHVGDLRIVLDDSEAEVLGLALIDPAKLLPENEMGPGDYREAVKKVRDDLVETIDSWGKLDIAGGIHDGKGEAVQDELNGLLTALRNTAKALRTIQRGEV